jgi:hypothetical protein
MKKQKELSMMEELILNSMEFDAVCPHCGRAVHITPKDLIWQFGCTYHNEKGEITKKTPCGFLYKCKCNKDIPVAISIGIDDDRVDKK